MNRFVHPVNATIGGKKPPWSIRSRRPASWVYQVTIMIPTSVTGSSAVVLTQGATTSNSVPVAIQ